MTDEQESLFEQALLQAGDGNWTMSASDIFDGWRLYRDEYGENPGVIRVTKDSLNDMYMDEVIRDIIVTEETVFMTPSIDPERNLELLQEYTSEDAFGLLMGMEIVIDDDFDRNEALLYQRDHRITDRSVVVNG